MLSNFGSRFCSWPLQPVEPSRELVVLSLSRPRVKVRSWFAPCLERLDLDSLHALQAGQVWVRVVLCRHIRSGFAPCLAGGSS